MNGDLSRKVIIEGVKSSVVGPVSESFVEKDALAFEADDSAWPSSSQRPQR